MFHLNVKWQVCCTGDMLFCIRRCLPLLFHNEAPSASSTFCWHAGAGRFSSCEGAECTCWKCFVLSPDGTFERGLVRTSLPGCIVFLPWCKIILFQTRTDWHLSCWEAPVRNRIIFGFKKHSFISCAQMSVKTLHCSFLVYSCGNTMRRKPSTRFQNLSVVTPEATAGAESNEVWPSQKSLTLGMKLISQPSNK